MNRRTFIGASAVASAVLVTNCGGKSVSGTVTIITGAASELKLLFPGNADVLDKISRVAHDFNEAWVAGKFSDARQFFDQLDEFSTLIVNDLSIGATARVKLLLSVLVISVRAIATLISEQATPKATAMAGAATVTRVRQLANPSDADWILRAVLK